MFFRFCAYLEFLRRSTNQHDVHSPFVYDFVTKCLYGKPNQVKDKALAIVLKCLSYFNCKQVSAENNDILNIIHRMSASQWQTEGPQYDLVFFENPDPTRMQRLFSEAKVHNETVLVINNIYKNLDDNKLWKSILGNAKITVSIDLYHCGVLFVRKEQAKEHFTIRI